MMKRPDRTLGGAHDAFWAWCAKDEVRLQQCESCGKLLWPVMKSCDRCGGGAFQWTRMSGRGRVVNWCTFVQDYYRGAIATPYDTILVELDEGPLFISNPQGFGEADAVMGLAVDVTFVDCEDSAGPFRLPVFRRAAG